MKYDYAVHEISKDDALRMIRRYHYSNTLPKINKHFVGFYLNDELVGVVTLGYGTRPMHTIKKLFPSLDTKDYLEIGRMCMTDDMPRNSESQMIKALTRWIKKNLDIKILFTWSDGMLGKVGYVYQACSFTYCGFYETDMYLKDGIKIHPRQTRQLFRGGADDKRLTVRPTLNQMQEFGINHYKGKQFKYVKYICGRAEKKRLMKELVAFPYPKEQDLAWRKKDLETGKWSKSGKPPYITDFEGVNHEQINYIK